MRGIRDWGLDVRGSGFGTRDSGRNNALRLRSWGIGSRRKARSRTPNPEPRAPNSPRGITLLEVLVSIFILAVGLLGAAALIPIGKLALVKTNISDRTGACGRAAMRDVEVRRMLNYSAWFPAFVPGATPGAIAIDPLGMSIGNPLGPLPRITLLVPPGVPISPEIFRWSDDLIFTMPEDMSPPQQGDRPVPVPDVVGNPQSEGNFSWFLTVCPSPSDIVLSVPVGLRRNYTVSVVVCHKRDFTGGEYASPVTFPAGIGYGGGTIQVTIPAVLEHIKTDQWVMLSSIDTRVAKWYRVVGVGDQYLSLVGPDWDVGTYNNPVMVVVEGVTGVYTTTVHLDADCIWTR